MIINDDDVCINIKTKDNLYSNLKFDEVEEFLSIYKKNTKNILPKQHILIPDITVYFSDDKEKNIFYPYVYKTSTGSDKWFLFLKDQQEGYALYENPQTHKMELAWYHSNLQEPLNQEEEQKYITCYIPEH